MVVFFAQLFVSGLSIIFVLILVVVLLIVGVLSYYNIENVKNSLEYLSKSYKLIVYSCKANPERPLINGKTGTELIWEWLEIHSLNQYIENVTYDKPNARYYIDDKGIRFNSWDDTLRIINILELKRMKLDA